MLASHLKPNDYFTFTWSDSLFRYIDNGKAAIVCDHSDGNHRNPTLLNPEETVILLSEDEITVHNADGYLKPDPK